MYLPRGRYIVLNNLFNNKKKLSKNFIKNLDICLNCNACTDFCPSNIDATKIYTELKWKYKYRFGIIPFYIKYFFYLLSKSLKKESPQVKQIKIQSQQTKEKVVYLVITNQVKTTVRNTKTVDRNTG